jgi:hypothetical protein
MAVSKTPGKKFVGVKNPRKMEEKTPQLSAFFVVITYIHHKKFKKNHH